MNYFILILGLAIVVMVALRLLLSMQQALERARFNVRSDLLSLELLQEKIVSAKREFANTNTSWNGFRKFQIARKEFEADDVCSFYLKPHDRKSIANFQPGQYLTFRLNVPGREEPVIRCYSLSDCFCEDNYRVTIKKVLPPLGKPMQPPGLISSFFHEQLEQGDLVDVQAPSGNFFIDPTDQRPAVLIAGGVGVTPILSMAKSIVAADSGRQFFVFYGVRHGDEHAFQEELDQLDTCENCRVIVCYSEPRDEDLRVEGQRYQHHGRVGVELIRSYLDSTNYDFFICGPPGMMQTLGEQLSTWGVSTKNIHTEAFGPATIKKVSDSGQDNSKNSGTVGSKVTFSRSGVDASWSADSDNLLDLAEECGVKISSGCRAGNCGTCTVAIKSGKVNYRIEPGVEPEEGSCLTCIAAPSSDLILDA